ncbi:MAG: hypothetical protein KCHDKBKB_01697 [Elusimicrobia bacterium]|nr:hypothetical protein [Elusimicrobiota bacterium]
MAIEMILKERLARENPILVMDDIDKVGDKFTASMKKIMPRLLNLGVDLKADRELIKEIIKLRNEIAHRGYQSDPKKVQNLLAACFGFISEFSEKELDEKLRDHLSEDTYHRFKEYFQEWDVIVEEAVEAAADEGQEDSKSSPVVYDCPYCMVRETVTIRDGNGFCHLCRETIPMHSCDHCDEPIFSEKYDPEEGDFCESCVDYWRSDRS